MRLYEHSPARFAAHQERRAINSAVQDWRRGRIVNNPHSARQSEWLKQHFDTYLLDYLSQ